MAEPTNRTERENDLKAALNLVWNAWVRVADPANLDPKKLLELLDKHVRQPLWGVWINGHEQLTSSYNKPATDAQIAAAFLLFYRKWADDLIARWVARISVWMTERAEAVEATTGRAPSKPTPQTPTIPIQGQGQPSKPPGPTPAQTPPKPTTSPVSPSAKPVSLPVVQPPPTWNRSKGDIVMDYDLEREAIDAVTGANTDAEIDAAKKIEASGQGRFTAIWRTEPGACPICEPLEGTPPSVWQTVAPNGPGLHPNCVAGDTRVQAFEVMGAVKTQYHGPLVRIRTASDDLVVTPNHMLLTEYGFIQCWALVRGIKLISARTLQKGCADWLYNDMANKYGVRWTPISPEALHGDGRYVQGRAAMVRATGLDALLSMGCVRLGALRRVLKATGADREAEAVRLSNAITSAVDYSQDWMLQNLNHEPLSQFESIVEDIRFQMNGFEIQLTEVLSVEHFTDSIEVYDFQTRSTMYYVGNGIVSSNCRCWLQWSPWLE